MRTRRQRGGFWPFTSGEEKPTEETTMETTEEEESVEDKGEGSGFFAGLFGSKNEATAPIVPSPTSTNVEPSPQGPTLSEGTQAGGAKKRKYHKRRTLRKRRSVRKSHKKSRKSMKSRKSQKSQKKH